MRGETSKCVSKEDQLEMNGTSDVLVLAARATTRITDRSPPALQKGARQML